MQHISAREREVKWNTREFHWSRIEWYDVKIKTAIFFFVMIWSFNIKKKELFFSLTRWVHSNWNEMKGWMHTLTHSKIIIMFNIVTSLAHRHKTAFWHETVCLWKGSQGWEMTILFPLPLSMLHISAVIIDYKSFNFASFAFEWRTDFLWSPWWHSTICMHLSCSRIYN